MRSFGEILRSQRRKLGLTQRQIAESAGVSDAYICSLETEKRVPPPFGTVSAIADILQLDVDWLWRAAVRDREKQAVGKSRRKIMSRRRSDGADDDPPQQNIVPDSQINAFFSRPEIQMATFGLFKKQPDAMSMEEKRVVFQAITMAQDFILERTD